MREPTDSQLTLASRIEEACEQCDLIIFKRRNVPNNFAMRPALALAVALYPRLEDKTRSDKVLDADTIIIPSTGGLTLDGNTGAVKDD